jgi:hypothetical protein
VVVEAWDRGIAKGRAGRTPARPAKRGRDKPVREEPGGPTASWTLAARIFGSLWNSIRNRRGRSPVRELRPYEWSRRTGHVRE